MDWDTGFRTLKQLYIEWINKKFPLHGTGNCISILWKTIMGKSNFKRLLKKDYIYICNWITLLFLTHHCKSTVLQLKNWLKDFLWIEKYEIKLLQGNKSLWFRVGWDFLRMIQRTKDLKSRLPWWSSGREFACQCRGQGFDPWSGKSPRVAGQRSLWATTTESVL